MNLVDYAITGGRMKRPLKKGAIASQSYNQKPVIDRLRRPLEPGPCVPFGADSFSASVDIEYIGGPYSVTFNRIDGYNWSGTITGLDCSYFGVSGPFYVDGSITLNVYAGCDEGGTLWLDEPALGYGSQPSGEYITFLSFMGFLYDSLVFATEAEWDGAGGQQLMVDPDDGCNGFDTITLVTSYAEYQAKSLLGWRVPIGGGENPQITYTF
jgi:hypothetical protein